MSTSREAAASGRHSSSKAGGSLSDVVIGTITCLMILGVLLWFAFGFDPAAPNTRLILVLSGTAGATVGWALGIILSPYDPNEKTAFREISKAVYGVAAGYLVAKIDPIVTAASNRASEGSVPPLFGAALVIGLTSFLAVATVTYVTRKYWQSN